MIILFFPLNILTSNQVPFGLEYVPNSRIEVTGLFFKPSLVSNLINYIIIKRLQKMCYNIFTFCWSCNKMNYDLDVFNKGLFTKRLIIEPLCNEDLQLIYDLRSNPFVAQYTGIAPYNTINKAEEYIKIALSQINDKSCMVWSIKLNNTSEKIGTVRLWNYSFNKNSAEIGYDLLPKYWRQGYASEAVDKVLEFCFLKCDFKQIFAQLNVNNINSIKVLQKSNFKLVNNTVKTINGKRNNLILCRLEACNFTSNK